VERLDRERIKQLLQEADDKWFGNRPKKQDYQSHLSFTASYVAENYHRKNRRNGQSKFAGKLRKKAGKQG
jgi:hypothetical protein